MRDQVKYVRYDNYFTEAFIVKIDHYWLCSTDTLTMFHSVRGSAF